MILLRSVLAAMGSSGGIAWSFFGIVTAAFSITAASLAAITLGAVSGGVFLLFSSIVLYVSYDHFRDAEKKIDNKLFTHADYLVSELTNYIELMHKDYKRQFICNDFKHYCLSRLALPPFSNTSENTKLLLSALLTDEKFNLQQFVDSKTDPMQRKLALSKALRRETKSHTMPPTTRYERFKAALFGFVGVFGAVAGCTSGFFGMLLGIGVISGLSAFPPVGVAILVVALSLSIYSAVRSVQLMEETHEKKYCYKKYDRHGRDLKQINLDLVKLAKPQTRMDNVAEPTHKLRKSHSLNSLPAYEGFFIPPRVRRQVNELPEPDLSEDTHPLLV